MIRPSLDSMLLDIARVAAKRATCTRLSVGAVLARDGRVLSTGYNGTPAGLEHCQHLVDEPCPDSIHAEANALIFAARHGVSSDGAELYVTHAPCFACAGLAINAGVSSVIYGQPFRTDAGLTRLATAGVEVWQH